MTSRVAVCSGALFIALAVSGCGKKAAAPPEPAPAPPPPKQDASVESVVTPPPPPPPDGAPPDGAPPGATPQADAPPPPAVEKEEAVHPLSPRDVAMLNYAVSQFKQSTGRNPKSLQEMVSAKFLPRIPQTDPSERLVYDPGSGRMKVEKIK